MSEACFTSESLALYVIGSLDAQDLSDFDRHLREGCEVCKHELAQARVVWAAYGAAAPPVTPRPELRERILAAAWRTVPIATPPRPAVRPGAVWPQAIAASLILAAGLGLGWYLRKPAPLRNPMLPKSARPPRRPIWRERKRKTGRCEPVSPSSTNARRQEAQLREAAGRKDPTGLEQELARTRAEAAAVAQSLQDAQARAVQLEAQARQLQGQVDDCRKARAREADQRLQAAENERNLRWIAKRACVRPLPPALSSWRG